MVVFVVVVFVVIFVAVVVVSVVVIFVVIVVVFIVVVVQKDTRDKQTIGGERKAEKDTHTYTHTERGHGRATERE